MTLSSSSSAGDLSRVQFTPESYSDYAHVNASVVSWAAILAGATAAAALSLILLILGTGLGLSSISPWANEGISASSFGVSTIVWLATTQILASGMGGYLAGRLRTKWTDTHADEIYFRDTAHGFLTWAVATLASTALLTSAIGTISTAASNAASGIAGGVSSAIIASGSASSRIRMDNLNNVKSSEGGLMEYFVDSLFRPDANPTKTNVSAPTDPGTHTVFLPEVTRIFFNAISMKALPVADSNYLAQQVSKRTGLTQKAAEKRVDEIFANMQAKKEEAKLMAKETADKARKATIYGTLWIFVSLLMGAFSASLAATCGGRSRDN
jgi:hypothetical protein